MDYDYRIFQIFNVIQFIISIVAVRTECTSTCQWTVYGPLPYMTKEKFIQETNYPIPHVPRNVENNIFLFSSKQKLTFLYFTVSAWILR